RLHWDAVDRDRVVQDRAAGGAGDAEHLVDAVAREGPGIARRAEAADDRFRQLALHHAGHRLGVGEAGDQHDAVAGVLVFPLDADLPGLRAVGADVVVAAPVPGPAVFMHRPERAGLGPVGAGRHGDRLVGLAVRAAEVAQRDAAIALRPRADLAQRLGLDVEDRADHVGREDVRVRGDADVARFGRGRHRHRLVGVDRAERALAGVVFGQRE